MKRKWVVVLVVAGVVVVVALRVVWSVLWALAMTRFFPPFGGPAPAAAPPPVSVANMEPTAQLTQVFHRPGMFSGVACGDLRGDGTRLILAAGMATWALEAAELDETATPSDRAEARMNLEALTSRLQAYDLQGDFIASIALGDQASLVPLSSLQLAQLDKDPQEEFILFGFGTEEVSAHDTDGSRLWVHQWGYAMSVAAGDIDGDGRDEVAVGRPTKGVQLLDSDGTLLWENTTVFAGFTSVGVGDLTADGTVEVVTSGRPRPRFTEFITSGGQASSLIDGISILDTQGTVQAIYPAPVSMVQLLVGELVATEPGPEVVVWGIHLQRRDVRVAAMTGAGDVLWQVSIGKGVEVLPDAAAVGLGHLAVMTGEGELLVFTDQGKLVARKGGFEVMPGVAITTDPSGEPLFVVACNKGLFGYTLAPRNQDTAPEPVGKE